MSLTSRFEEAFLLAAELHRGQQRKGSGVPYLSHLLAVSASVIEHGGDEDEAIAALLHDAIEDQGGPETRELIRERFGDRVVQIVDGCTDTDVSPKPPWRARKETFIEGLRDASASVHLVVAADKLHNSRATLSDYRQNGDEIWAIFQGGRDGILWYYRSVVETLDKAPTTLIDQLWRVVRELESST